MNRDFVTDKNKDDILPVTQVQSFASFLEIFPVRFLVDTAYSIQLFTQFTQHKMANIDALMDGVSAQISTFSLSQGSLVYKSCKSDGGGVVLRLLRLHSMMQHVDRTQRCPSKEI